MACDKYEIGCGGISVFRCYQVCDCGKSVLTLKIFCIFVSNSFVMNYLELKNKLHEMIDQIDDPEVLYAFQNLLSQKSSTDSQEELSKELKEALDIALKSSKDGKVFTHEEALQMSREKFPNLF
jgi:hypothetical protein